MDALIGEEEYIGIKEKSAKRKKQGAGPKPSTKDHLVASYEPQGSQDNPVPFARPVVVVRGIYGVCG